MSDIQFNVTLNDPFNYDISGIVWDAVHRWESIITTNASHISSMNLNIDISSLDTGVYMFNVTLENGSTSTFSVVKK